MAECVYGDFSAVTCRRLCSILDAPHTDGATTTEAACLLRDIQKPGAPFPLWCHCLYYFGSFCGIHLPPTTTDEGSGSTDGFDFWPTADVRALRSGRKYHCRKADRPSYQRADFRFTAPERRCARHTWYEERCTTAFLVHRHTARSLGRGYRHCIRWVADRLLRSAGDAVQPASAIYVTIFNAAIGTGALVGGQVLAVKGIQGVALLAAGIIACSIALVAMLKSPANKLRPERS